MINNNELINQIKSYNKFLNSESLSKAYDFALEAHQNQKREEGVRFKFICEGKMNHFGRFLNYLEFN